MTELKKKTEELERDLVLIQETHHVEGLKNQRKIEEVKKKLKKEKKMSKHSKEHAEFNEQSFNQNARHLKGKVKKLRMKLKWKTDEFSNTSIKEQRQDFQEQRT